jgi:hypothetical protein
LISKIDLAIETPSKFEQSEYGKHKNKRTNGRITRYLVVSGLFGGNRHDNYRHIGFGRFYFLLL